MLPSDETTILVGILRRHYHLAVISIHQVCLGAMNHCLRVESRGGAYCLKVYNTRIYGPTDIARTCKVQEAARMAGVPAPEVVRNVAGAFVTATPDGFCVLSRWIDGRAFARPSIPPRAATEMGRTLGRIHVGLQEVEPSGQYRAPDPVDSRRILERCLALAEESRSRSAEDETSVLVLRHKLASLARLERLAPELSRLQTQLTHGDYQETNVLFDSAERVVGVLDFDNARHQPRGAELTRALLLCFLDGEKLMPEAWDFVAGYGEMLRLPEDEVRLFVPLRAYLSATGAWPITDRYLKPEAYQPRWDRFIRPPSGWWEENRDWMTERLVSVLARG